MKRIFVVLLLLVAGCFETDPATYPQNRERHPSSDQVHIVPTNQQPVANGDPTGAFRTDCRVSHSSHADPIVKPPVDGQPGGYVGHLHSFFGNTLTGRNSTSESIRTTGSSTCEGGIANRSAYWAPSMLDVTGEEPYDVVSIGDGFYDQAAGLNVYYKTGYDGVDSLDVQNFPVGLRMIAGNSKATSPQYPNGPGPGDDDTVRFSCAEGPGANIGEYNVGVIMPQCDPGDLLIMAIQMPQCWDSVNLDSPDHKSHMAYARGWPNLGCPASHPVPLAQISQLYRWRVPASGMRNWRLASDVMLDLPAGTTAHADWMSGWDPAVFQRIVDNCFHAPTARDCQTGLLGDGFKMVYP